MDGVDGGTLAVGEVGDCGGGDSERRSAGGGRPTASARVEASDRCCRVTDGDGGVSCNNCQRAEIRTLGNLRPAHEDEFWQAFRDIAKSKDMPINVLASEIDVARDPETGLASAIRVFVLNWHRLPETRT